MDKQHLFSLIRWFDEVYFYATRKIKTIMDEELLEDITSEQYFAIHKLKMYGPVLPSELAAHLDVNRSAITSMVDRLVAKGLVERIPHPQDRRNILLQITAKGDEVFALGQEKIYHFIEGLMTHFTQEEVESFMDMFKRIADLVRN